MAVPTRASTSKLLERTSRQLRGDYRRQSAETEEAQLNDFLQEVRQQTTLSTEADRKKPHHQQQKSPRRRKVHLGSDVSDVSVTSSSSGGARAAAGSRFLKSNKALKPSAPQSPPQPQPSSAPPKRTSSQQPQQQHHRQPSAPGRHSAVLDKASRLTSQRGKQQQQQSAAVSTSMSSSLTDPDRPKSRKARLQPTAAEAREADDETQHQLYRHRASLYYLTESESHSIGRDGARFLRRTTDATPERQRPADVENAPAQRQQPPLTPKSPKQLRFSTEHHVMSFTADSAEYDDSEDDEETHSNQADRLVIRHRAPVPPIELSQDSSIGEVVARKPALKKSSSFSDIQGDAAAGLLETSRQFESIDTDEPPTRRSDAFAPVGESIEEVPSAAAADARDDASSASSSSSDSGDVGGKNIIIDFEQLSAAVVEEVDNDNDNKDVEEADEDAEFDRSVAEEMSTAEASDRYDSDFEAEAAPSYTQDFEDIGGDGTARRSSWDSNSAEEGGAAAAPSTSSSSSSRSTVREEIRTTARDESSRRGRSRSGSSERTESRSATNSSATTGSSSASRSTRSSSYGDRRRHNRRYRSRSPSPRSVRIRDAESQTQPQDAALRYQWDPAGFGQAAASRGLGLGSVDPAPIASLTVSADDLEAVTAYSPATVALNSLVRDQLALTAAFLASQRRLYQGAVEALRREPGPHRYTTLQDTREFIKQNRPKSLTFSEALRLVEAE